MNERFKELCAQAGFIGESMFPVIGTTQETALQNLIELVAKECSSMCHYQALVQSEIGSVKSGHKEVALDAMGLLINSHFGVKE